MGPSCRNEPRYQRVFRVRAGGVESRLPALGSVGRVRWRRHLAVLAVVAAALALAACAGRETRSASTTATPATSVTTRLTTEADNPAPPACDPDPHPAGQSGETFDFEGQARTYQLYVPRGYDGTQPVPLVFDFHGFGSNAAEQMAYGDFRPLAEEHTFLIVAPDGQGDRRHFNLAGEAGLQDDVQMVLELLDRLEADFCIDATRVFSTGMSDGGAMTSVLACRAPDRFAAFGPVAVVLHFPGCGGSHLVAIAAFMGTDDPIVPFEGGTVKCCGGPTLGSAPDAVAGWAEHNGCDPTFTDEQLDSEVRRRTWSACDGGEVVFYIIDGGGHTWPGAAIEVSQLGLTTQQVDASATIWDFFAAHPLTS